MPPRYRDPSPLLAPFLFAVIAGACSDYDLGTADDDGTPEDDDTTPIEDDDTTPPADDDTVYQNECGEHEFPAGTVPVVSLCAAPTDLVVVTEWYDPPWTTQSGARWTEMTPVVTSLNDDDGDGDADEDDVPDVVAVYFESTSLDERGALRAMSGDGSGELWSVAASGCSPLDQVATGDIDGDGWQEVVCAGPMTERRVTAYRHDGTLLWETPELPLLTGDWDRGYWVVPPSLCDLDRDGDVEVLAGRYVLDHEGATVLTLLDPPNTTGQYFGASICADVDFNGDMEILAGGSIYDDAGTLEATLTTTEGQIITAQLDLDDEAELITSVESLVRAFEHDGTPIWEVPYYNTLGYGYQSAATLLVADFDEDGLSEIGVPDANGYKAIDDDGSVLWTGAAQGVGISGSTAHDLDSDGILEIAYQSNAHFYILSAIDGSTRYSMPSGTEKTQSEYPVIADVDGDGSAEIVLPHSDTDSDPGIQVLGSGDGLWQPTDRRWNQFAYHVTNIDANGTVPVDPDPPWLEFMAFRQARPNPSGGVSDLIAQVDEVCNADCDEDVVRIWYRIANQGTGTLAGPVEVAFYASDQGTLTRVASDIVPDAPDEGELLASRRVDLPRAAVENMPLVVIVDDDGGSGDFGECDEENNLVLWAEPMCPVYPSPSP